MAVDSESLSTTKNFFPNYLERIGFTLTFALPKENWDFTHVAANQNKITVIRS
jgi:hypothetical protein